MKIVSLESARAWKPAKDLEKLQDVSEFSEYLAGQNLFITLPPNADTGGIWCAIEVGHECRPRAGVIDELVGYGLSRDDAAILERYAWETFGQYTRSASELNKKQRTVRVRVKDVSQPARTVKVKVTKTEKPLRSQRRKPKR